MKYNDYRRVTRKVKVGDTYIGGDAGLTIQSMTTADSRDFDAVYGQIKTLEGAGCDIVRMAVPDAESADIFAYCKAKRDVRIPLVADIHFDYKIALRCAVTGADKIRINPGNIGAEWKVREVVEACKASGIPIRIGVNGGSLEKSILEKYGSPTPQALAESAFFHAEILERYGFSDIIIAIKSSDVKHMIEANRIVTKSCAYPLHLGVTEAGGETMGTIKSSVGIGSLLCDGIGDTLRVSLTADPVREVAAAQNLLKSVGLWEKGGVNVISCPTCARTKIDLISLADKLTEAVKRVRLPDNVTVTAAVMGCAVNGPGEAREADIGIAGGIGEALMFKKGVPFKKIPENEIVETMISEIMAVAAEKGL
jgi:1-hydroxy-2-methyl-2-(E)-butenyl 4-diphosphate synthase